MCGNPYFPYGSEPKKEIFVPVPPFVDDRVSLEPAAEIHSNTLIKLTYTQYTQITQIHS